MRMAVLQTSANYYTNREGNPLKLAKGMMVDVWNLIH